MSTFNTIESALSRMQFLNKDLEATMRDALLYGDYTTAYEVAYVESARGFSCDQDAIRLDIEAIVDQTMAALGHRQD